MAKQYTIELPNGQRRVIEGPDDATDEELIQFARSQAGSEFANSPVELNKPSPPTPAPTSEPTISDYADALTTGIAAGMGAQPTPATPGEKPVSQMQGFSEGFWKPFNNLAGWTEAGLNLLPGGGGMGLGDRIQSIGPSIGLDPSVQATIDAQQRARDASGYQSGDLGKFAGEVAGTALASRIPGGAFVKGAQGGALLSDNPGDPFSVGQDALVGGVTGKLLDIGLNSGARIASPRVSPELRTLTDAGVRVTPGQVGRAVGGRFGNAIGRAEDRATSAPFLGDAVIDARNQSLEDFGRATLNRAVGEIGLSVPENIKNPRAQVRWAGDRLSDAYNAIVPRIRVTGDQQFMDDLTQVRSDVVSNMLPARAQQFDNILTGLGRFWNGGTELRGHAFKDVETRLTSQINRLARSTDADQQQLGDALEGVRDAMQGLAARQNPEIAEPLRRLNRGWKSLTQVERASATSRGGTSPAGYSQAVKMSSDTVRRRGYSRGEALNQDLADAGSSILPSQIADSGTAGRLSQQSIPATAIGIAQTPAYLLARGATPLLLRQNNVSPELARLLEYGATASPYVAPAMIEQRR